MADQRGPGGAEAYDPAEWITRLAVPTRGVDAPSRSVTLTTSEDAEPILDRLAQEVPEAPWVVVVDGHIDDFAENILESIFQRGRTKNLWLLGKRRDNPQACRRLNGYHILELRPDDPADVRFAENLAADVVVVPMPSEESAPPRIDRWQRLARYVLSEAVG